MILPPLWGLAEAALLDGDPGRAVERCARGAGSRAPDGRAGLLVPFVVTGVRAEQAAGRPAAAERGSPAAPRTSAGSAGRGSPAIDHGRAWSPWPTARPASPGSSLEAAVRGWDAAGRVWEATWARLDLAKCLTRSNRFAEAVAPRRRSPRHVASRLDSRAAGRCGPTRSSRRPAVASRSTSRGARSPPASSRSPDSSPRADERRDRRFTRHRAEDGEQPRRAHPRQARCLAARRDRRVGESRRAEVRRNPDARRPTPPPWNERMRPARRSRAPSRCG